jgi:phytoene dehydrogenase-like protein
MSCLDAQSQILEMASREDHFAAATRFLAPRHFHQSLWIPETEHHARLRVTFATTSNFATSNADDTPAAALPAMLFAGPMFGTRYMAVQMDRLSRESGVRGIFIDR